MALKANFSIQTNDACMMARLHRASGLELVDQAETDRNEAARVSAKAAVEHANTAIVAFREALRRLPDFTAASVVKRSGDIILLESGSALNEARRWLLPDLDSHQHTQTTVSSASAFVLLDGLLARRHPLEPPAKIRPFLSKYEWLLPEAFQQLVQTLYAPSTN